MSSNIQILLTIFLPLFIGLSLYLFYKLQLREKENENLNDKLKNSEKRVASLEECISKKDNLYEVLKENNQYSKAYIPSLLSDFITLQYSYSEQYLLTKKHPARKEALRINDLKRQTKDWITKYKEIEYKYEYLQSLFPELDKYSDLSKGLINEVNNEEETDDVEEYLMTNLSKDEYNNLNDEQKAERALEFYIRSNRKTNWQLGRDYELSVGYEYEQKGYQVEYTGITNRLEDLGRDLIVHKNQEIFIVQCKYWSSDKVIREKHIAQLFGTAKQYEMEIGDGDSVGLFKQKVVPILITSTNLSDTAKKFAKYLGVEYQENRPFKEFPRIKCNASKKPDGTISKIFHLPMDQQYDKTLIKLSGEYRVKTVKEAIKLGFRRAFRYRYSS